MDMILLSSLAPLGFLVGLACVFGYTNGLEPTIWLVAFILWALWIAKKVETKHFLHGFWVGLIGGGVGW